MEYIPKNELVKQTEDSLFQIRKNYDLHNPERLKEAIDILEEWVKKQTHFLKRDFPREYYERTLISSKGSVEKSKRKLDRLCTMRTLMPKYFSVTNVKIEVRELLDVAWLIPMPILTPDFCRVAVLKISSKDIESHQFLQYYQYIIAMCEYIKRHDYVNGFKFIGDFRKVNIMALLTKVNLVDLQEYVTILIEGFGARFENLLILSESKTIELLLKTLKQLVIEKIGKRFQVLPNLEELAKYVPKECLPSDYGGTDQSTESLKEKWLEALSSEEHIEYLKMMRKAGTDESLRQLDKFNEDYIGMPGSFRTLSVD